MTPQQRKQLTAQNDEILLIVNSVSSHSSNGWESRHLCALDLLEAESRYMEDEFQRKGHTYTRSEMQSSVNYRQALLIVRTVLANKLEVSHG